MAVPVQPVDGFYYDELSKVRVVEPDTAEQTQELKDECKEFVESEWKPAALWSNTNSLALVHYNFFLCAFSLFLGISEFQGLVGSFIGTVDSLAKLVEKEKMKVINLL